MFVCERGSVYVCGREIVCVRKTKKKKKRKKDTFGTKLNCSQLPWRVRLVAAAATEAAKFEPINEFNRTINLFFLETLSHGGGGGGNNGSVQIGQSMSASMVGDTHLTIKLPLISLHWREEKTHTFFFLD